MIHLLQIQKRQYEHSALKPFDDVKLDHPRIIEFVSRGWERSVCVRSIPPSLLSLRCLTYKYNLESVKASVPGDYQITLAF